MPPASTPADRNLLFGILALQMDFIRRDALIAAMHAWVLDKDKPLGQILKEQGALGAEEHALLEALVVKHLQRHENDPEKSLASVSSIASVRQQLQEIADPDLQASLGHVSQARNPEEDPFGTRAGTVGTSTSSGLRFRILRPHAKGGLGQVSVALDEELHREVALKEIQDRHADDHSSRARFLLEAEVTGGLEHPGVVPVYGLGQYADGRPFYAMRFIRGDSLQDALQRFHREDGPKRDVGERALALRQLLGRFVDVCNAVAYAHSRGVLHRDLKPGNVMLGKYGETLVVDWGLAKALGRPEGDSGRGEAALQPTSASGSAPTQMGSAVGTPPFMSPEQAAGRLDQLGPASDVYSLGATLYCLLTGKLPFEEKEVGMLLRKVQQGDFLPPRQVKHAVPAALEAVCLKAMMLRPEERYVTALELAADVEHWLADEPVTAYREPWSVRTGRWLRRHRPLVAGAAALLLAAVPLSLVIAVNREQARQQAETDRLEIARQKTIAEDNERAANEREAEPKAVLEFVENRVFAAARPEGEAGGLGHAVTLRRAVEAAIPFVARSFPEQPLIEARLRLTLGASFWYLGDAKISADQYEAARALYARHRGPDHPDTLTSMNNLALIDAALGRQADALKLREETLTIRKAKLGPDHPDTLMSMNNLANSYFDLGRQADALKLYEETLKLMKAKLGPDHPDTLASMNNLAATYAALGRHAEALKLHEETLTIKKAKLGPDHPDTLISMNNLANRYADLGQHVDAFKLHEETLTLRKAKLGPDHPDTLTSMANLANRYADLGRPAEALKLHEETLTLRRAKLGPDHPDTLISMLGVAESLVQLERGAEAVPVIDDCVQRATGKVVHPRLLPVVIDLRLRHFEKMKDPSGCRQTAEMWEKLNRADAGSLYDAGCMRAVTAAVLRAADPSPAGVKRAGAEADLAMDRLNQAVAAGYKDAAHMAKDPELAPLRDREEFKKLLAKLKEAAEPAKP